MMKYMQILSTSILFILIYSLSLFGGEKVNIEYSPTEILRSHNTLPLELTINNFSGAPVREVNVFFRWVGENRFDMVRMENEGFSYYAQIDVRKKDGHMLEYYFRIAYLDGSAETYPAGTPVTPLLHTAIQVGRTYDDEIFIISPEPGEQIMSNDVVITASFTQFASAVDVNKTKMYLDTWDVSQQLTRYNDFVSFAPKTVPPGRHKIRLELFNENSDLVAAREWYFTGLASLTVPLTKNELNVTGRFFAETRQEDLKDGDYSHAYNQSGLSLHGIYNNWQFGGRLYLNNQENSSRQPVNRYSGFGRVSFWDNRSFELDFGDAYPRMNPLIMQNIFIRGIYSRLYLRFLNVEVTSGKTLKAIEGKQIVPTDTNQVERTVYGTFRRNIFAIRPSFGSGENFQVGLTYQKGKDDPGSIKYGINPQENAAAGLDLFFGLDQKRIIFEGSFGASSYNRNIKNGSIPYDTLKTVFNDLDEKYYDLARKFITVNQYFIIRPGLAYQARLILRYYKNNLSVVFESVDEDYYSLGQPYLLRDNQGFHVVDNINLIKNQVFLSLGYRQYHNNLQDNKSHTTTNRNFNVNLSYFPLGNLPELTFGYNNYARDNGVSKDSIESILNRPEDNQTNSINFATGYRFNLINLKHRIGLNVTNYSRTDIFKYAESSSNYLAINLRSQYNSPLETILEFIIQQTETGVGTDSESKLDMTTFGLGARYIFTNLFTTDRLFLSGNIRYGQVNSIYSLSNLPDITYNRNHFALRANYSIPKYGTIGLSGDILLYSGDREYNDIIYTVRYNYNF
jgi:hypothetical protein